MIRSTELPSFVQPGHLLATYQSTHDISVVLARPSGKNEELGLFSDLLRSTSVRDSLFPHPESVVDLKRLLIARLVTIPIRHVLVLQAHEVSQRTLDELLLMTNGMGVPLTLIYGIDQGDDVRNWVTGQDGVDLEWGAFELPSPTSQSIDLCAVPNFPPDVPETHFLFYRNETREFLDDRQFAMVDDLYCSTYAIFLDVEATEGSIRQILARCIRDAVNEAHAITTCCAAQAALLKRGYLLRIDVARLRNHVVHGVNRRLNAQDWATLQDLFDPSVAAIIALIDLGYSTEQILELRLRDVAGVTEAIGPARALRALSIHRYLSGAKREDQLIESPRLLRNAHVQATCAGVRGIGVSSRNPSTDKWQYQSGVSLRRL